MRRNPVTGAYAEAILAIAEEQGKGEEFEAELQSLQDLFGQSREFRIFFESPKIPRKEKVEILDRTFADKVGPSVLNLLKILVERGRQQFFGEICEAYTEKLNELRGRTSVRITSAVALTESRRTELLEAIGKKIGRTLVSEEHVDEKLLGGMTIRIGDAVIDGSVRTRLNLMRETLAAPRIGSELFDEN